MRQHPILKSALSKTSGPKTSPGCQPVRLPPGFSEEQPRGVEITADRRVTRLCPPRYPSQPKGSAAPSAIRLASPALA